MSLKVLLFAGVSLVLFAPCRNLDDPYMTLTTKTLDVEVGDRLFTIDLSSNAYYRVNNSCQTDGSNSHQAIIDSHETQGETTKFIIKVSGDSSTSSRIGTIRFVGDDVTPLKLVVTQKMIVPRGISPITESIDATTTESSFKVLRDKKWKTVRADADVTVSPANGVGKCDIKLTFPRSKTFTKRTIKITVTIQDDIDCTYTLVQDTSSDILADWGLNSLTANTNVTFTDEAQSVFPGADGKCLAPSAGSGRIEYQACDRAGYVAQSTVCSRAMSDNGGPYVSGAIPGDYWYVCRDMKGATIPAGTKTHFYFIMKLGTMCSNYQMIESKDGEEWKSALPTSTLQKSTTETLSGAPINCSATITYNFAGMLLDNSNNGTYIPARGVFTTTKDMDEIVLRFGQVGRLCLSSARYAGKYIDWTHTSNQTYFSTQHSSDPEAGATVEEYNQHVLLEIVE